MKFAMEGRTGLLLGIVVVFAIVIWVIASVVFGLHWLMGMTLAFIFSGAVLFLAVYLIGAVSFRVFMTASAGIVGLLFGWMFGAINGGLSVSVFSAFLFGGAFAFGTYGVMKFFGTRQQIDPEEIRAEELLENARGAIVVGNYEKAVQLYKELSRSEKDKAPARTAFAIGDLYLHQLQNFGEARYWFRRTIALANKSELPEENPFRREAQLGLEEAEALSVEARRSEADGLAEAEELIENKRYDEAEKHLETMERAHINSAEIPYLLGHLARHRHIYGLAVTHFIAALERDDALHPARYFLARTFADMDQLVPARDTYREYLEKASGDTEETDRIESAQQRLSAIERELLSAPVVPGK